MGPKQAEAGFVTQQYALGDAPDAGSDRDKIAFVDRLPIVNSNPSSEIGTALPSRSVQRYDAENASSGARACNGTTADSVSFRS